MQEFAFVFGGSAGGQSKTEPVVCCSLGLLLEKLAERVELT